MTTQRVQADADDGIGIERTWRKRDPAHADPEWYQRDLDDQVDDPDGIDLDPFVNGERDRKVVLRKP